MKLSSSSIEFEINLPVHFAGSCRSSFDGVEEAVEWLSTAKSDFLSRTSCEWLFAPHHGFFAQHPYHRRPWFGSGLDELAWRRDACRCRYQSVGEVASPKNECWETRKLGSETRSDTTLPRPHHDDESSGVRLSYKPKTLSKRVGMAECGVVVAAVAWHNWTFFTFNGISPAEL